MKQVLILMLFSVCIVVSFAQSFDNQKDSNTVVTGRNVEKFLVVYENSKSNPLLPFLLNFFIGFGVGSLFQGDITGGLLVLGADILGLGLIASGSMYLDQPSTIPNNSYTSPPTFALALVSIGGITLVVTRIVEMVIPFTYASSYNKKLQEELAISLGGLKPEFDINLKENAGLVFELAFTKKY